nr:MAG: DNA-binding protein [Thermoproteus sp. AZ2]
MGRAEVEILRERARMFLEAARDDLRAGRVDLAAFHAEQASQLALKYILARETGYYPRTHSLKELFEAVKQIRPDLWRLYLEEMFVFEVMEDAYIGARYLPRRYSKEVAVRTVEVAERLLSLCI